MLDFSKRLDPKRPLIHPTSRVKRCALTRLPEDDNILKQLNRVKNGNSIQRVPAREGTSPAESGPRG